MFRMLIASVVRSMKIHPPRPARSVRCLLFSLTRHIFWHHRTGFSRLCNVSNIVPVILLVILFKMSGMTVLPSMTTKSPTNSLEEKNPLIGAQTPTLGFPFIWPAAEIDGPVRKKLWAIPSVRATPTMRKCSARVLHCASVRLLHGQEPLTTT